jgi:hypothetical protein
MLCHRRPAGGGDERGVGFLGIDYRDNAGSASLALFFLI